MIDDVQADGILVSIVIPIFNAEKFLRQCVSSIVGQTHRNIEVILVDDGSTDGSSHIANELAQSEVRIAVIRRQNAGVSAARNAGLDRAVGAWITFVDADDWLAPSFVRDMLLAGLEFDADFVISTSVLRQAVPPARFFRQVWTWNREQATEALLYPGIPVGCWNKLYRREFLRENSIDFSPRFHMGEGLNFITDVSQRARVIAVTASPLYYYRRDNFNSVTSRLNQSRMRNALEAIDNIENRLVLGSLRVRLALEFHRWWTCFLALVVQIESGQSVGDPQYEAALAYLRKHSLRMLTQARLSRAMRLKATAVAMAPEMMGRLVVARRRRRGRF